MTKTKNLMVKPNLTDEEIKEAVKRYNSHYLKNIEAIYTYDPDRIAFSKPTHLGMWLTCFGV